MHLPRKCQCLGQLCNSRKPEPNSTGTDTQHPRPPALAHGPSVPAVRRAAPAPRTGPRAFCLLLKRPEASRAGSGGGSATDRLLTAPSRREDTPIGLDLPARPSMTQGPGRFLTLYCNERLVGHNCARQSTLIYSQSLLCCPKCCSIHGCCFPSWV